MRDSVKSAQLAAKRQASKDETNRRAILEELRRLEADTQDAHSRLRRCESAAEKAQGELLGAPLTRGYRCMHRYA